MSARSLRSGVIKTGDSIQRATRRNTTLFKTENGFQQARQIDKRPLASLMLSTCSPPKRKRKDSPPNTKQHSNEPKKKEENPEKEIDKAPQSTTRHKDKQEKVESKTNDESETESLKKQSTSSSKTKKAPISNEVTPKEVEHSMRRTPRMASISAIVKVNDVLDSFSRPDKSKKMAAGTAKVNSIKNSPKDETSNSRTKNAVIHHENSNSTKTKQTEVSEKNVKQENGYTDNATNRPKELKRKEPFMKVKKTGNSQPNSLKDKTKQDKLEKIKCVPVPKKPRKSDETLHKATKSVKKVSKETEASKIAISHSRNMMKCKLKQEMKNKSLVDDDEKSDYETSYPDSTLDTIDQVKRGMLDQCIQANSKRHKSIQTNSKHLPNYKNKRLCTCKVDSDTSTVIPHYSPINPDFKTKPIYVKSSILAHTTNHTLVVPLRKRHVLKEKENEYSKTHITNNISSLLDSCINNTLLENNKTCSKLVYLANYKEKTVLNNPVETKKSRSKNISIKIPKFNNVSSTQVQKTDKEEPKINTIVPVKKLKSPLGRRKKCNGWQFEGEPMEEPYTLGSQIITRRHYESVSRNKEVLHIHDAVLLKSGMKGHNDYLARVSMFWEDLMGPNVGEMMMSIYWYYKPGQTNFKFPETSEMEVYASRHRDDNSVACIVEKCYVVSFTQFCRFQAQKMLLKEKRMKKLKVVPEKGLQSRFLPSPDVEESVVFFCRYGYEHRVGKIMKGF